jgi:hypothetical protein
MTAPKPRKNTPPAAPTAELKPQIEATEVEFTESDDAGETDDQALMRVCQELGDDDGAMVYIHREGKTSKERVYVDEMPPGEFTLQMLKDEPYNGGTFRIFVRAPGEGGFRANRKITVEPRPKRPEPPAGQAMAAPGQDAVLTAIQAMQAQNAEMMKGLTLALQGIGTAMQHKGESSIDKLNEIKLLKEIFAPGTAAPAAAPSIDPMQQIQTTFELAKTIAKTMAGGESSEGGLLEMGKSFIELLTAQAQNRPPAQAANGQGGAPQLEAPNEPPENNEAMMMQIFFNQVIAKAQQNVDPIGTAYQIVEMVPEEQVRALLDAPDWMTQLAKIDERVLNYPAWFDDLRANVRQILTPDAEDDKTGATST